MNQKQFSVEYNREMGSQKKKVLHKAFIEYNSSLKTHKIKIDFDGNHSGFY